MTVKKKHFIIIVLLSCCAAISIWAIIDYQAKQKIKEQYNKDLAQRFDKTIDVAYPLIENYAIAMEERADSIESIARKSKKDTCNKYRDAFSVLWEQYVLTESGIKCYNMIEEYEYFKVSPVIEMLVYSGDKKKKESDAIKMLTWAGDLLKEPYLVEYDSIMKASKKARLYISDCIKTIKPYRSKEDNIRAWRNLALIKHRQ